jgi:hypothetical protein
MKELRENAVWAAVALVVGMGVIFFRRAPDLLGPVGTHLLEQRSYYEAVGLLPTRLTLALPLLWSIYLMALFCFAWGAALGLVQTLVERGRGTYQLLLALPVTRLQVLRAKVLAGGALYLLSVGIPFGLLILRAATPGHYPSPFRFWMIGPGVAAIACGLLAYGGAVLTVLRSARWYVSRGAPLAAAAGISLFAGRYAFFGAALAIAAAALMLWASAVAMQRRSF